MIIPWAKIERENTAKHAATKRVFSQEKVPEPRITRTICARTTMKRNITGKDQKTIAKAMADLKELHADITTAYQRWETLEAKRSNGT